MKTWAIDTETWLFQQGLMAPRIVCGSWADAAQEWIGTPEEIRRFFVDTLEAGDHLVGVNIAYDIVVMAARWPELLPLIFKAGNAGQFHCCSVREALHDIAALGGVVKKGEELARYSMALMMERHFGQDISSDKVGDVWRYKYASLDGVPLDQWPAAAVNYPKLDARRTFDIWKVQEGIPGFSMRHKNLHDEPAQVRAAIALQLTSVWGFRTDGVYLDHVEKEVDQLWNDALAEFTAAGLYKDGVKDTAALKTMVVAAYGEDAPKTKTGRISYDRDTLADSGVPILEKLANAGKNDKRKTTYIPALRKGTHVPINPEFNVLVDTGRLSSNFQQLPQKGGLREAVIARPGRVNGSLDYGGLELRTMAQRAILTKRVGFSKMAEFINSGKDPHSYVAAFFLGISLEEFLYHKAEYKSYRDVAKMFNFGAGGGAGGFAIAYNAKVKDNIRLCLSLKRAQTCGTVKTTGKVGGKTKRVCALCVEVAKELKAKWLLAWPEQGMLFQIAAELTRGGAKPDSVTFGSERVRSGCGYSQWLNSPFQGAGGDGMKRAMWRIQEAAYADRHSALWGSRVILNIHDELWIEFPDSPQQRHDAAFLASKIMVDTMNEITPDVRNECTPALMRRMFKAASDVYDRAGLLKPWWPAGWDWSADREQMCADLEC